MQVTGGDPVPPEKAGEENRPETDEVETGVQPGSRERDPGSERKGSATAGVVHLRALISRKPYLLALLLFTAIALFVVTMPLDSYVDNVTIGDAVYYPVVSYSIAHHGRPSFDGITSTNGFHPLICYLFVPVAALSSSLLGALDLYRIYVAILSAFNVLVWLKITGHLSLGRRGRFAFMWLFACYWWSVTFFFSGIETPLVLGCAGLSLLVVRRLLAHPSIPSALLLGLLLALTFLARLDSAFLVGTVLLYLALRGSRFRHALIAGSLSLLLVAPYLLYNSTRFGGIMPVSGARKSVSPSLDRALTTLERMAHQFQVKLESAVGPALSVMLVILVLGMVAYILWVTWRPLIRALRQPMVSILLVAAAAHFIYVSLFMTEGYVGWYLYLEYTVGYLICAYGLQALESRRRFQKLVFACIVLAVPVMLFGYSRIARPNSIAIAARHMGEWVEANTAPEAVGAMYDSGIFRVYSARRVVPLNALIGDRELLELFDQNDFPAIVERYGVDFVVFRVSRGKDGSYGHNRFHISIRESDIMHREEVPGWKARRSLILMRVDDVIGDMPDPRFHRGA